MAAMRIPRIAYSVTSQGLVSACNFLLCLALLYFAEARHYVAFLLFMNVVQLLVGLQNALFVSPVGVLVPRMAAAEVARAEKAAYGMAALIALAGLPLIAAYMTQPPRLGAPALAVLVATFLCTILLLQREIARNACLVRSDMPMLVKYDALYFVSALSLAAAAVALHALTFVAAVLAFALPACLTRLSRPQWAPSRSVAPGDAVAAFAPPFWGEVSRVVQWAVPGVVVTWLFSNGYWFVLERTQGTQAVANVGAARLLFTPAGLMIQAWLMQLRPMSVAMVHAGKGPELRRLVLRHSIAGAACIGLLTLAGFALLAWRPDLLPPAMRAEGVGLYVAVWGMYFAVFWFRSGLSTLLLTKAAGFRTVFYANVTVCVVFYLLFFASLGHVPLPASIGMLVLAEILMICLLHRRLHD
jgi:hypothetical protein